MNHLTAQQSSLTSTPSLEDLHAQRLDRSEPLCECVRNAVRFYLQHLGDHAVGDLHGFVMREIERPLIEEVLGFTQGNQSRASAMLGLSRTTLRKKLALYQTLGDGADAPPTGTSLRPRTDFRPDATQSDYAKPCLAMPQAEACPDPPTPIVSEAK
jgi:Fis family transcriptional regulator